MVVWGRGAGGRLVIRTSDYTGLAGMFRGNCAERWFSGSGGRPRWRQATDGSAGGFLYCRMRPGIHSSAMQIEIEYCSV